MDIMHIQAMHMYAPACIYDVNINNLHNPERGVCEFFMLETTRVCIIQHELCN